MIGSLSLAVLTASVAAAPFPFPVSHDSPDNVVNMRGLLDAPAGKHGFLRSEGEHFVHSNGTIRLNGINLTGPAVFPAHDEAEALADRFARFGFNCARLHFFDCAYSNAIGITGRGIFVENEFPRRKLDPERVDRLHYLVAAFKKRGIYTDVNLRVGRTLDARDGVVPTGFANRGANFLDPKLRAFEKEYARDLLTLKNAYTGLSLADDPAVAIVEIYNENGLLSYHYYENKLEKLPEPYRSQLAESRRRYRERTGKDDFVGHLIELDRAYWVDMRDYLKRELKVKCPVVGTVLEYSPPHTQAELDAVDIHLYWEHPENGVAWWRSVLDAQFPGCCILGGGDARVKGRPFLVTESNNPYPSPFGSEYQPILHAYGAFQDWAGVFAYTWNCTTNAEPQSMEFYFSYAPRSDCVAHFPTVAALFLRGDVKRHRRRIDVNLPKEVFADRLRSVGRPARLQGVASASGRTLDETLVLVHGVGVDVDATTPAAEDASWEKTAGRDRYASDTGELVWTAGAPGTRHFTADTAGTKFLSGFAKGRRVDFSDGVSFAVGATSRGWAAVSLVSHDDTGFGADGRAARLLLTATAGGANTGLVTEPVPGKEGRRRLGLKGEWGTAPYLVEGVPVAVTLKADPARVRCWALDPAGARKRAVSVMAAPGGNSLVRVDPSFQTLWYEIEVDESAAEAKRLYVLAQTEARLWKDASGVLPYRFHAPAGQKPGQRYPLVVLMHGAGSRGTDNVRQVNNGGRDLFDWARRTGRDFFFLAPQCPEGRQWVDGTWGALTHRMAERPNPQMAAAMALVEDTIRREAVDPARVYVMGISMGGYATWELLQRRPDLFSGALPCCGGGDVTLAERLKDVPVWAFHGDDDGVVPVSRTREMIATLRKFGAPALYREYPGVNHDCWTRTYADDTVFYWLFSNRRKGMKPPALTGVVVPHTAMARVASAWNGKKVAFLGDSITDPVHVGCTANYWNYLPDILGIDAFVYGKNGWRMGDIPIQAEALAAELGDAVDAIFVLAGTNDYNAGVPLGEWFDEAEETVLRSKGPAKAKHRRFSMDKNTFRGRINRLVSYLKKTFPRQQIVLMTALHRGYATFGPNNVQPDESYSNTLGLFIDDYNDDIRAAGRLWSVPVLDLFERSGLFPNEPAHTRYFSKEDTDRLHPSSEGHRRIAETMAAWMQTIPPDFKFSKLTEKPQLTERKILN